MIITLLFNTFVFLIVALLLVTIGLYFYFQKQYKYWDEQKVPHAKPVFPFGNFVGLNKYHFGEILKKIYDEGKYEKYYGFWQFHRPTLMINDPELIKKVMIGDFMNFHDRGSYYNEKEEPLSAHLGALEGSAWRNLRVKLTPVFTSGKMKIMFPVLAECGNELEDVLLESAVVGDVIDIKDYAARFATDFISSAAFGIEAHSLKDPNVIYRKIGKKVFEPTWSVLLKNLITFLVPDLARLIKLKVNSNEVSDFFFKTSRDIVEFREINETRRNDAMQLLIDLYKKGFIEDVDNPKKENVPDNKEKFTIEQLATQVYSFFVGGFETSSSFSQFTLFELAKDQNLQNKVRKEIRRIIAKHNGQVTYEAVFEMDLLGRVMEETLRKYPTARLTIRICTKDYKVPDSNLTIEKGVFVIIPIMGLHNDERYYPDPDKFDPDRFTEEGKASRLNHTYLPFGEGPRICLGQRFAQMQMRVGLVSFLNKFKFEVSEKYTPKNPLEFDPKSFLLSPKGGMHLKISLADDC